MPTFDQPFVRIPFDATATYPDGAVFCIDVWQECEFTTGLTEHHEVAGTIADLDAFLDRHFSEPCWQYRLHVRVPLNCDADQLLMVLDAVSQPKAA